MPRKTIAQSRLAEGGDHASMRPRPDAAENRVHAGRGRAGLHASMRPRPDAAENQHRAHAGGMRSVRFNEAAARCRGKPGGGSDDARSHGGGFNEAAARCRGKPQAPPPPDGAMPACFNEAAARCRGKPPAHGQRTGSAHGLQ